MSLKHTTEEFIKRVHSKYGDRFDTSMTEYKGSYFKVKLRCKEHNITFECDPVTLCRTDSKGDMCPECRHNKKLTEEGFLALVVNNYGTLYDLSKVKFTTTRGIIILGCKEHGDFEVAARYASSNDSLELCPKCKDLSKNQGHMDYIKRYSEDKVLGNEPGVFYTLLMTHNETGLQFIKAGITSLGVAKRYQSGQYAGFTIESIDEVVTTNLGSALLEKEYKQKNIMQKIKLPDNMRFDGHTECYLPSKLQLLKSSQLRIVKEILLKEQNGVCGICGKVPKIPVVDHWHQKRNHGDGCIRGVICSTCNIMVAVVENNLVRNCIDYSDATNWLRSLAKYLETETKNLVHPTEKEVIKITKTEFKALMKKYIEKYPKKVVLKYPVGGKANARLQEIIKEFND